MKFTNAATAAAFTVLFWGGRAVHASPAPIKLHPRADLDVYVPPVTSPKQGDCWGVGQQYTITWDLSNQPSQITNSKGNIMLRKGDKTSSDYLACDFNITDGDVQVTCPSVTHGDDYRIVLMGDSGNWSPKFTIRKHCPE